MMDSTWGQLRDEFMRKVDDVALGPTTAEAIARATRFANEEGVYVITDVPEADGSGAGSPDAAG